MFVLADVFLVHILKSFCFFTDDDDDRSCTFREPLFWHLGLALTNLSLAIYVCYTARLQSLTMSKIIQQTWMKGQKFKGRTCFSFLFFREEFLIVVVVLKKRLSESSWMREGTDGFKLTILFRTMRFEAEIEKVHTFCQKMCFMKCGQVYIELFLPLRTSRPDFRKLVIFLTIS